MKTFPSVEDVNRIAAISDPAQRNYQITQCYWELSAALTQRLGPVANWCSFATWASKQAGQSIRQEDLQTALEQFLAMDLDLHELADELAGLAARRGSRYPSSDIRRLIWEALDPKAAMQRAGEAVGRGNQKVFAEIGLEFARFMAELLEDPVSSAARIEAFGQALRPGNPPDGQQYLRQAFAHYYQAFFEPDANQKAELILLANLEIGLHEQTRLQPEIAEALEAAVLAPRQFARRLLERLFPGRAGLILAFWWLLRLIGRPSAPEQAVQRIFMALRLRVRLFLTDHLMTLDLAGTRLRLGQDVQTGFPDTLSNVEQPELLALLQQVDPTPNSIRASGALDWADLSERMHFIADLFRRYQEYPSMLDAPFTAAQVEKIKSNSMP
ncbi:MAG: hypothetical protein IT262_06290 [Saprospiraceae bacterium]|nr:hypothetical protein [Saprospiraceae bacterium]